MTIWMETDVREPTKTICWSMGGPVNRAHVATCFGRLKVAGRGTCFVTVPEVMLVLGLTGGIASGKSTVARTRVLGAVMMQTDWRVTWWL